MAILLSVTSVEAFINLYFRTLVEDAKYAQHRLMVLDDLTPSDGIRPKGLENKLKHWPPKILGKSFAWQKGVAHDFDRLRERRNALMHFTNSFETIEIPGIRIQGLADTACYDDLVKEDANAALRLAEGMLEEVFRLTGVSQENIPERLHAWTGQPPTIQR